MQYQNIQLLQLLRDHNEHYITFGTMESMDIVEAVTPAVAGCGNETLVAVLHMT